MKRRTATKKNSKMIASQLCKKAVYILSATAIVCSVALSCSNSDRDSTHSTRTEEESPDDLDAAKELVGRAALSALDSEISLLCERLGATTSSDRALLAHTLAGREVPVAVAIVVFQDMARQQDDSGPSSRRHMLAEKIEYRMVRVNAPSQGGGLAVITYAILSKERVSTYVEVLKVDASGHWEHHYPKDESTKNIGPP